MMLLGQTDYNFWEEIFKKIITIEIFFVIF